VISACAPQIGWTLYAADADGDSTVIDGPHTRKTSIGSRVQVFLPPEVRWVDVWGAWGAEAE